MLKNLNTESVSCLTNAVTRCVIFPQHKKSDWSWKNAESSKGGCLRWRGISSGRGLLRKAYLYEVPSWSLLVQDRSHEIWHRAEVCGEGVARLRGVGGGAMSLDQALSGDLLGLRDMRHRRRLTVGQLGKAVGCSGAHISQIERGVRRPSLVIFVALAKVLECSLTDLVNENGR